MHDAGRKWNDGFYHFVCPGHETVWSRDAFQVADISINI